MELYKEIVCRLLREGYGQVNITFSECDPNAMVESVCYRALCQIQSILADDTLEDPECYMKIEEVLCVLEDIGGCGGLRHDEG